MAIVQDTIVVIPCYNEATRIDLDAFSAKLEVCPRLRFVFVDDGSVDDTAVILQSFAAKWPGRALPLVLSKNSGKAEAVRHGLLRALELGSELIGFWDADLATPLDTIDDFAALLENPALTLVIGSRIRRLGAEIERLPLRHYVGRVVATAAAMALGLGVYDTQCGAKLFRVGPAIECALATPFELNWLFDVELLARLQGVEPGILTRECVEMPLETWRDAPGSKLTQRHFHGIALEMMRLPGVVHKARTLARPTLTPRPRGDRH
jgi:glycosyltransferase involved in cell wall biosynthesis